MPDDFPEPEPLSDKHLLDAFDCGNPALTEWLKKAAGQNQRRKGARTFVTHRQGRVVGYYSLAPATVQHENATGKVAKGMSRYHPIPAILLARLAVDKTEQGKGLGAALLEDALKRCLAASDQVGGRAVIVDAFDAPARAFYEKFGFERSPTDEFHLMLPMQDIQATLKSV